MEINNIMDFVVDIRYNPAMDSIDMYIIAKNGRKAFSMKLGELKELEEGAYHEPCVSFERENGDVFIKALVHGLRRYGVYNSVNEAEVEALKQHNKDLKEITDKLLDNILD